jgi:hypothetical protein
MPEPDSIITEHVLYTTDQKVLICLICRHAIKLGAGVKRARFMLSGHGLCFRGTVHPFGARFILSNFTNSTGDQG